MSNSTDTAPEPQGICRRCKEPIFRMKKDWYTVEDQKLICKGGGPHDILVPEVDWTNWRDVLDEWTAEGC